MTASKHEKNCGASACVGRWNVLAGWLDGEALQLQDISCRVEIRELIDASRLSFALVE